MINLGISLVAAFLAYLGVKSLLGVWWQALFPALLVLGFVYYFLAKTINERIQRLIEGAMKPLESLSQRTDLVHKVEQRNQIIDEVVKKLKEGYRWAPWQFFIKSQLNAQIGVILFSVKNDSSEAFPFLEKSFQRHWVAQGMLAIAHMKKHNPERMKDTFEVAVRLNKKQELLWGLYAFCLSKIKKDNEALDVLVRAQKELPNNVAIQENLSALQNNKKIKMKLFGDNWYQFGLEKPVAQKTTQMRFSRR